MLLKHKVLRGCRPAGRSELLGCTHTVLWTYSACTGIPENCFRSPKLQCGNIVSRVQLFRVLQYTPLSIIGSYQVLLVSKAVECMLAGSYHVPLVSKKVERMLVLLVSKQVKRMLAGTYQVLLVSKSVHCVYAGRIIPGTVGLKASALCVCWQDHTRYYWSESQWCVCWQDHTRYCWSAVSPCSR